MTADKDSYHHGDLRPALIKAAIELIAEKDVSSLSLREVARRVGVSHAAPYRHFADKQALLAAVAQEGFQGLTNALNAAKQEAPKHPWQQLETSGVAYVQYAIAHPSHYRVMFGSYRSNKRDVYPCVVAASQQAFAILVNIITEGQMQGAIRPGEPKQLAWVAWSLVHGLAMLIIDGQLPLSDPADIASVAHLTTKILTEGLKAKSL